MLQLVGRLTESIRRAHERAIRMGLWYRVQCLVRSLSASSRQNGRWAHWVDQASSL